VEERFEPNIYIHVLQFNAAPTLKSQQIIFEKISVSAKITVLLGLERK
jgi:hypothetical protein